MKKKLILGLTAGVVLATSLIGCGSNASSTAGSTTQDGEKQVKIAVIRNLPSDDHTKQYLEGAVVEGEAFGYQVDTYISNGDDAKFQELVAQQIQKDYDGLIISHGKAEYSTQMLQPALDKGMKIVTFDTAFDGDVIPASITATAQDDHALAELSLAEIVERSESEPAKIVKLWFGPGIPPLDRREEIYKKYEDEGKIQTIELVGPSNFDDVQGEMAARVGAVLAKYPEGSIDAIWASWDELAKGAYKATQELGRTDIPIISIDISNQDINLMMEQGSIWKATAAVDPKLIGTVNMRILAKKLNGEETPETYNLEAHIIKQEQLKADTTMNTLADVVPGWGQSDAFNEPWMDELRAKNTK